MLPTVVTALIAAAVVAAAQSWSIGQTVKTTSGDVTGRVSKWKPQVSEYLGIPYAQPPVGKLRWAAPVPYNNTGKPVNATKYVRMSLLV